MRNPQAGIFALGTSSHAYLEFDAVDGRHGRDVVAAIASLREPRTTMGGVNLVAGFRPELWSSIDPDGLPSGLVYAGFSLGVMAAQLQHQERSQHFACPSQKFREISAGVHQPINQRKHGRRPAFGHEAEEFGVQIITRQAEYIAHPGGRDGVFPEAQTLIQHR